MINNLSTILREQMKQTNKNKEVVVKKIPDSFLVNVANSKAIFPYNLRINVELANKKTMELYQKYNTNAKQVPMFKILDLDKDKDKDKELNKTNKNALTICGICVFAFLAYSYFKKR